MTRCPGDRLVRGREAGHSDNATAGGRGTMGTVPTNLSVHFMYKYLFNTNPTKWAPSNLTIPVYYCTIMYHRWEGVGEDKKRENQFVIVRIMQLCARQGFVKPHG